MRLLKYCVLLRMLACCAASYFHELSMTMLQPPLKLPNDSFFGYSMTYDGQNKNVVVTAPRADLVGQVFSCDITANNCSKLDVMPTKDNETNRYDPILHTNHYHHFWLGASVKADSENLLVCAPRFTDILSGTVMNKKKEIVTKTTFGTSGRCYVKNLTSTEPKFEGLLGISSDDRIRGFTHLENMTDTFGWSIDIAKDHSARVGSPAISVGRMMTYPKAAPSKAPGLLNGYSVKEQVNFNFGYSIATGNFFKDHYIHVAVSTPYGEFGRGKVIFFDENNDYRSTIYDDRDLVGTMFGAALCSAILTHKRTSILIGAPAFYSKASGQHRYHTGRVLIYLPDKQTLMKYGGRIEGPKDGGFFGASIVNVGDMDEDKLDEIAIAAPYEDDGRGAVYLYTGSALAHGSDLIPWLQRFQPEEFMNFGLSLSALQFSDNGCNDLAIGAPGNDKVAVYHCIPSVTVDIYANFPILQTRKDKTSFEFESCLKVKYPQKPEDITAKFTVTIRITHPNATLSDKTKDHESYDEIVQRGKEEICRPIKVLTSKNGDYEQDIQFDITAQLIDDPALSKVFDPTKATVSNHSRLIFKQSVRAADCKNEHCKPELKLDVKFNAADPYLIGSTAAEKLEVRIRNGDGDTAYRPCARVTVDGDVTVLRSPSSCVFDNVRQRTCQLQGPLASNSEWDIGAETAFELDMTSLTSESPETHLRVDVFNRCNTSEPVADPIIIPVNFKNDTSGVRIEGKTDQGEIVKLTRSDVNIFGKTIHHTYTITNTKGTNWKSLVCKLILDKNPSIEFMLDIIQVYRDESSNKCEPRELPGDSNVLELTCDIGDLFKEDIITVVIPFFVPPGKLDGKISETSNITVHTKLSLQFDYVNKDFETHNIRVTTTLTLQEALLVPIWIIVVAVLVGLFLLCLLAFALYECGFLRRKTKEKLEDLKTDVKRKTMILHRQSMRLSDSERAALSNRRTYRELLDQADAKEAEEAEVAGEVQAVNEVKEACQPTTSNGRQREPNEDFKNEIEISLKKQLLK